MRLMDFGFLPKSGSNQRSHEVEEKVLRDQIDLALRLAPLTMLAGLLLSASVCFYFVESAYSAYGFAFELVYAALAVLVFSVSAAWHLGRVRFGFASLGRLQNAMTGAAAIAGVCLGALPALFYASASPNGQVLIAATAGACLATSICVGFVPRVGLVYSIGMALGCYAALFLRGTAIDLLIGGLLTVYAAFLISTTCVMARLVAMRSIAQFELEEQRAVTELLLHDFEESASDWLWETDAAGRIVSPSSRFADVSKRAEDRLRELQLVDLFENGAGVRSGKTDTLVEALRTQQSFRELLMPIRVDGEQRWWSLTAKPLFDRDQVFTGFRGVGADVTVERLSLDRLDFLANHDPVTQLPNRRMFGTAVDRARQSLAEGSVGVDQTPSEGFAIHYVGLHRFAQINATFGHFKGDELLSEIGRRLGSIVGPGRTISRFTADQFAILVPSADERTHVQLARQLLKAFDTPFYVDDLRLNVEARIGIAVAADGEAADDIIGKAHTAFLQMKGHTHNGYLFYAPVMDVHKRERAALMGEVRSALDRGEFSLNYQPIVTTSDRRPIGFEALMRWNNPVRGPVSPGIFIELAEETGTILELGAWALKSACAFAASLEDRSLTIAVNISTVQIEHSDLFAIVNEALAASGLEASRLELEVTESALLTSTDETIDTLERIRRMGVSLSLDDFGTGYSSLSYLRKLPFDKIKIDRSFIRDLPEDQDSLNIVRTIVDLGRSLSMKTIAEGIETYEQLVCLKQLGCPELQGYFFGKPVAEDEARKVADPASEKAVAAA